MVKAVKFPTTRRSVMGNHRLLLLGGAIITVQLQKICCDPDKSRKWTESSNT